ncbi:MAG TPA: GPP34 family phosphoprotein [Anaerolineaceae bacterium]|nr:GPP34 family phosphoprotein [Anaerolineaceae bacterium]
MIPAQGIVAVSWQREMLTISEALLVLAIDEEDGDIVEAYQATLESILPGAVLAELVLQNRIGLADQRVVVIDPAPTGHRVLDQALFDILDTSRPRRLKYWMNTLTYKKFHEEIGHELVEKGVLVRKKKRLRLAGSYVEKTKGNGAAQPGLQSRIHAIVFAGQQPDLSEKVLLAFLVYGELVRLVIPRGDRKLARKRMRNLIESADGASCLGETLDEILAISCQA